MVSPLLRQWGVVLAVLAAMLGQGMVLGFTSSLLTALQQPGAELPVRPDQASSIVAAWGMGILLGCLLGWGAMDRWGRRVAYCLVVAPGLVGTLLLAAARDVPGLVAARVLAGSTAGGSCTVGAVVIGEYCSPRHRGMFLNLKTSTLYLGSLLVHALDALSWRPLAVVCAMPYALAIIVACTWPESPAWLAQRGRFAESERAFRGLRGYTADAAAELEGLIASQKRAEDSAAPLARRSLAQVLVQFLRKFTMRKFLQPALISLLAALLLESSGRHAFPAYAAQIVRALTGAADAACTQRYVLAADALMAVSALSSAWLVRALPLRVLLFTTGSGAVALLAGACALLQWGEVGAGAGWGAGTLLALYCVLANLGMAPVPLALMGELFPLEHRAAGTALSGFAICLFLTLTLKLTPLVMEAWGVQGVLAALAAGSALALAALWGVLPETRGRTLQDIAEDYHPKARRRPPVAAAAAPPPEAERCLC